MNHHIFSSSRLRLLAGVALAPFIATAGAVGVTAVSSTPAQATTCSGIGAVTCTGNDAGGGPGFILLGATEVDIDGSIGGVMTVTSIGPVFTPLIIGNDVGVDIHDGETVIYNNNNTVFGNVTGILVTDTVNATLNVNGDVTGGFMGINIGAGVGTATVNNSGNTIDGLLGAGVVLGGLDFDPDNPNLVLPTLGLPGTVTINNHDEGTITGLAAGVFGAVENTLTVDNPEDSTISGSLFGMFVGAGGDINVNNAGLIEGGGVLGFGGGAFMVSTAGNIDFHGGTTTTTDGAAIFGIALDGNVGIGHGDDWASATSTNGPGIIGIASGDVTIHAGEVNTGPGGPISTGISEIDDNVDLLSGGVLGRTDGGSVDITTYGKISTEGNFGAMAVAKGGSATVTVNAAIDPPILVGAGTLTFGPGDATTTTNAAVEALGIGAFAGNFGSGNVTIDANDSLSADFIGALAFNIGDGETNVDISGPIGGYSADATFDDGVLVYTRFGEGNTKVETHADATINAGDDGIDVFMASRDGNIDVATGDDITAADQGIIVKRKDGSGDTEVSVGANGQSDVLAGANGVRIKAESTDGDVIASVFEDSTVIAPAGSAIRIKTSDDAVGGNNDVDVFNAGALSGAGGYTTETIRIRTDGFASIFNDESGTIGSQSDRIMSVVAGFDVGALNLGEMTGRVDLTSLEGDVLLENIYGSGGIWTISGESVFAAAGDTTLNNLQTADGEDPVIYTLDETTFAFFAGGTSTVNNTGIINVTGMPISVRMTVRWTISTTATA